MNDNEAMLADIFIKSPEQKILSLFAMNPDRAFYGREVSRKLGISLGATHAALVSLEKNGVLSSVLIGKTKLYSPEASHQVFRSFRILNTLLVLEPLVADLRSVSRRVLLFGSYADGTFTSSSDLDLMVISNERREILRIIDSFKRKSGLDIRPIIKDQVEWTRMGKDSPEFFSELARGITLWEKSFWL